MHQLLLCHLLMLDYQYPQKYLTHHSQWNCLQHQCQLQECWWSWNCAGFKDNRLSAHQGRRVGAGLLGGGFPQRHARKKACEFYRTGARHGLKKSNQADICVKNHLRWNDKRVHLWDWRGKFKSILHERHRPEEWMERWPRALLLLLPLQAWWIFVRRGYGSLDTERNENGFLSDHSLFIIRK